MNKCIERELAKQLENIPNTVQFIVEKAILNILGISHSSRGYDIDRFSSHGLNKYISERINKALQTHVEPYVEKEIQRLIKLKTLERSVSQYISKQMIYSFDSAFRDSLQKKFEELGTAYASKLNKKLDEALEQVGNINMDITDPDSFKGPLGELLLEDIAEKLSEEELSEESTDGTTKKAAK